MRTQNEKRHDESSPMRAIVSAWMLWALIILGLVASWAVQVPVLEMWPRLIGETGQDAPASGSNAGPIVAPFATAAGPASGGLIVLRPETTN